MAADVASVALALAVREGVVDVVFPTTRDDPQRVVGQRVDNPPDDWAMEYPDWSEPLRRGPSISRLVFAWPTMVWERPVVWVAWAWDSPCPYCWTTRRVGMPIELERHLERKVWVVPVTCSSTLDVAVGVVGSMETLPYD